MGDSVQKGCAGFGKLGSVMRDIQLAQTQSDSCESVCWHRNKGKWCKARILKKDLKIYSQMYVRSFPTAGGLGERERERECVYVFVLESNRLSDRDWHNRLSDGMNQPLDTVIDNRKGVDRLQGFWKVNGKDA